MCTWHVHKCANSICIFLHMGCVTCLQTTAQVWGQHATPHNTYNIVIGLVSRHPKRKWRYVVQLEELCFKFDNDNDDLEQNKQGVIVKNLASDTQSCMQGQSWQCLREFNHQKRTMDTMFQMIPCQRILNRPGWEYVSWVIQMMVLKHCAIIKSRQPLIVRAYMKYRHNHTLGV